MPTDVRRFLIFQAELPGRYEEGSTLAGVIYVHRISDNRFSGITARNFNLFRKLCGESTLKNVILVTNMWGVDPQDINEARERELAGKFFKPALDKGAQMARHYDTAESAHEIIRRIVDNHPVALQIQRELVDEHKDIGGTTAGDTVDRELEGQIKRHQAELKEFREEMVEVLIEKDDEMREKLDEAKRDLQERVGKAEEDLEALTANYAAEKERAEAKVKEMEQGTRQERERAEAEHDQELAVLTDHLQSTVTAPAANRADWEQGIKDLQDPVTIPIY